MSLVQRAKDKCDTELVNKVNIKKKFIKKGDYYYIRKGDFDLVSINVAVFVLGHILLIPAIYIWFFKTTLATKIYG